MLGTTGSAGGPFCGKSETFKLLATCPVCLFLSLSLTCRVNALVCTIMLWSNQFPSPQCFFYTGSGWPKFAYVTNPVTPETRCVTYKLRSQQRSHFCFSILLVLYTQDTFEQFSNFEVGHFVRHFLFLFSGVAMKGIQFTQLHCYISFLSFTRLTTCFLYCHGRLLNSHKCRLFCLHIQHTTHCLFERQIPVGSSEAAVCRFCLSISLQKVWILTIWVNHGSKEIFSSLKGWLVCNDSWWLFCKILHSVVFIFVLLHINIHFEYTVYSKNDSHIFNCHLWGANDLRRVVVVASSSLRLSIFQIRSCVCYCNVGEKIDTMSWKFYPEQHHSNITWNKHKKLSV